MAHPTAMSDLLQHALARLDPRDILNFPECTHEDIVNRPDARPVQSPAPQADPPAPQADSRAASD